MSYAVIMEKDSSNDILKQIQNDADVFVDGIMKNQIGFQHKFDWLDQLSIILKKHCRPVSNRVDIIRFTGLLFAMFNTIMMHFLLNGKISITVTSIMPIFSSLIGVFLSPNYILFFCVIELLQVVIGLTIISVAFFNYFPSGFSRSD